MIQSILLAICLEVGHIILWTDCTSTSSGPPAGEYICHRCFSKVVIEKRVEK